MYTFTWCCSEKLLIDTLLPLTGKDWGEMGVQSWSHTLGKWGEMGVQSWSHTHWESEERWECSHGVTHWESLQATRSKTVHSTSTSNQSLDYFILRNQSGWTNMETLKGNSNRKGRKKIQSLKNPRSLLSRFSLSIQVGFCFSPALKW